MIIFFSLANIQAIELPGDSIKFRRLMQNKENGAKKHF